MTEWCDIIFNCIWTKYRLHCYFISCDGNKSNLFTNKQW